MDTNEIDIDLLHPGEPAVIEDKVNNIILGLENGQTLDTIAITKIDEMYFVRDGNNRVKALLEYCFQHNYPIPKVKYKLNNEPFPKIGENQDHSHFLLYLGKKYGKGILGFKNVLIVCQDEYEDMSYTINQDFENNNYK